jgi:hypothetical protein
MEEEITEADEAESATRVVSYSETVVANYVVCRKLNPAEW